MQHHNAGRQAPTCLVFLPHSYVGRGPAESCVRIIEALPEQGIDTTLFVLRARKPVSPTLNVVEAAGPLLRRLPFRHMRAPATRKLHRAFARAIDRAAPGTIAWFWPDSPTELVRRARKRGLVTVREMINSPLAHAKPILDAAYAMRGLLPAHGISDEDVVRENDELTHYDRLFASNPEVEKALLALGVEPARILSTSYGWDRQRFLGADSTHDDAGDRPLRVCFVGLMNVRKGIPDLIDAWKQANVDGELVVAGSIEGCLRPMLDDALAEGILRHVGHVDNVAALYRSCDMFVFPTLEEGGPQVTYEAASCGLPVITTPMGAARLVENGSTGLVVEAGNVAALAEALRAFAADAPLRKACGEAAQAAVERYEYRTVGRQRADLLLDLFRSCEQTD